MQISCQAADVKIVFGHGNLLGLVLAVVCCSPILVVRVGLCLALFVNKVGDFGVGCSLGVIRLDVLSTRGHNPQILSSLDPSWVCLGSDPWKWIFEEQLV